MIPILVLLASVSAFLCILGKYNSPVSLHYIFKPFTMICVITVAFLTSNSPEGYSLYSWLIIAGLFFSLAGDIFLMLPSDRFIQGLLSFLTAHIIYIIAFTVGTGFGISAVLIFLAVPAIIVLFLLLPHAGEMKIPVTVYLLVIMIMSWQAWERYFALDNFIIYFAPLGVVLFMISDTALAFNRFKAPFKSAEAIILSTYFSAQMLIALST